MPTPHLTVHPDPRRKRLQAQVDWPGATKVTLEIPEAGLRVEGPPGPHTLIFTEFTPWTPSTPQLYTLRCRADIGDPISLPVGMREVSVQEQRFTINQRPTLLKGVRCPPVLESAGDLRTYATSLRDAGFNWLRCRCDNDGINSLLEVADSLGLLISLQMEQSRNADALQQFVRRVHHHPSLLFWEWMSGSDEWLAALRDADPMRPVVSYPAKDRVGQVFRPFQMHAERFEPVEVRTFSPVSRETESFLSHLGHTNALNTVSVFGFTAPADDSGPEFAGHAAEGLRTCAEQLRANPRVAAYCFEDALGPDKRSTDISLAAFKEAQAPVRAVITLARTNLVPREEVEVSVLLLNDAKLEGRAEMSLQVVGPTNQTLWKKKRGVKIPKHGKELWTGTVSASGSTGPHRFVVQLLADQGLAVEGQAGFFVSPPVEPWKGSIDVLDPAGAWSGALRALAPHFDPAAQVILVPPLARSIRAYPENPLGQVLGRVREGAVAIVFDPPQDWADLSATLSAPVQADVKSLLRHGGRGGAVLGRLHPVFEGLPAGAPLGRPYRGVLSQRFIAGDSEDDIAPVMAQDAGPGAVVAVRHFGNGRIVFTSLRLLERLGQDPVADRLFINLLRYSERRALPYAGIARAEMKAVEWLRHERARLRTWRVIGPFPNPDGAGHSAVYPPETAYEPDAAYVGLFRALTWTAWHQGPKNIDTLDVIEAVSPNTFLTDPLGGTFYAYGEIAGDGRSEPELELRHIGAAKLWLNGRLTYESPPQSALDDALGVFKGPVVFKQGRNTIVVKSSVIRTPPWFEFRINAKGTPVAWRWQ